MIKTFIDKDIGHVSYIVYSQNEAVVIDPSFDIKKYKKFLKKYNLNLKYVLNTHLHADFLSSHQKFEVDNVFYKDTPLNFTAYLVDDGDILKFGDSKIKIIHTPGHTPWCISFLIDEKYLFSGDFLFIGDIGRADLTGDVYTLAKMSYNTAQKLKKLDDGVMVFTSHIKGSFCGKNLNENYFSTIGIEKKTNKSFMLEKKEYIKNLTTQKIYTPPFFKYLSKLNAGFKINRDKKVYVDIRNPKKFAKKHLKGSINIYKKSNIALIAGYLIDEKEIILLQKNKKVKKTFQKLGFKVKYKKKKFNSKLKKYKNYDIIDLEKIKINEIKVYKNKCYKIICKNGYKSSAFVSYLIKNNIKAFCNV